MADRRSEEHRAIGVVVMMTVAASLAACTPAGLGPFGGGASSQFSSVGAAIDPTDSGAQSLLLDASTVAMVIALDEGGTTFVGLTAEQMRELDPSVKVVGDAPARVGVVSLNYAGDDGAVLSTKSKSGRAFCVTVTSNAASAPLAGSVDAHGATSLKACAGKNWLSDF